MKIFSAGRRCATRRIAGLRAFSATPGPWIEIADTLLRARHARARHAALIFLRRASIQRVICRRPRNGYQVLIDAELFSDNSEAAFDEQVPRNFSVYYYDIFSFAAAFSNNRLGLP